MRSRFAGFRSLVRAAALASLAPASSQAQVVSETALGDPAREVRLHENVIRGAVRDDHGAPVPGAAVEVDGELLYTNSEGAFFARKKKAREYRLEARLDEFLIPGRFEVIDAPSTVEAAPEDRVRTIDVIIRRVASDAPTERYGTEPAFSPRAPASLEPAPPAPDPDPTAPPK